MFVFLYYFVDLKNTDQCLRVVFNNLKTSASYKILLNFHRVIGFVGIFLAFFEITIFTYFLWISIKFSRNFFIKKIGKTLRRVCPAVTHLLWISRKNMDNFCISSAFSLFLTKFSELYFLCCGDKQTKYSRIAFSHVWQSFSLGLATTEKKQCWHCLEPNV